MRLVLVLQEVLRTGTLRVVAMLNTAFKGEPFAKIAVSLARQSCKPERLFVDNTAVVAGARHLCATTDESEVSVERSASRRKLGKRGKMDYVFEE